MGESERRGQEERGAEPVVGGRGDGRGLPRRDWGELGTGPAVGWGGDGGTRTCGAGGSVGQAPATAQEEVSSSQTQVWGFIGGSRPHWEGTFSHPNPTAAKDTVGGGGAEAVGHPEHPPMALPGSPNHPPAQLWQALADLCPGSHAPPSQPSRARGASSHALPPALGNRELLAKKKSKQ